MHEKLYKQQLSDYLQSIDVSRFAGKSFLITGATGMIGSALVDLLLTANDMKSYNLHVYAMGRSRERGSRRFLPYWDRADFDFIEQDVRKPMIFLRHFDYIIHAAGNAYPQAFADDPVGTMTANFLGVYNMLEYARVNKAERLLYVSSGEVYGELDKPVKAEHDYGYVDVLDVRSCYPNGKRAAETLCVAYSQQYDVDTVMVRPSHVYGPTMTARDNRAVSDFLRCAAGGENIVMHSNGTVVRSYTYVLDAVYAILLALVKGQRASAYNIADDQICLSLKEIAEYLAKISQVEVIIKLPNTIQTGCSSISRQVLDADRLHGLGWKCQETIYSGLAKTLEILR